MILPKKGVTNVAYLSRSEEILSSKITGDPYDGRAQSRLEKLLLQLNTGTGVDTTELTREVQTLKDNVRYLDTGMTKNANNIDGVKTSVTAVQKKVMAVQSDMDALEKGVDELNRNIRDIQEDVIHIEDHAIFDSGKGEDYNDRRAASESTDGKQPE